MKVSKSWLKELVDLNISDDELVRLLPLRTIGVKEVTPDLIELDMKGYNRADLLSLRGVAFEVAAITQSELKFEERDNINFIWVDKSLPSTPVKIEGEELAEVQAVAKIEGLKFDKSSEDWIKKLNDSGMRSVNNIADVTNLIMLEYGHPLHAFDTSTVKDDTINVRRAKEGEEITTLDGKIRKLTSKDIVLADNEKALDVAGVMGGKGTEVKESTTTILLSASLFNPPMVRATSQRLKLASEASKRFYHGLTKKRLYQALDAAIRMYESLGGKLVSLTIAGNSEEQKRKIPLGLSKIQNLIGVKLDKDQVETYLSKLGFKLEEQKNLGREPGWIVTPPYFRLDVEIEEDLIEEIARMYGYENIDARPLEGQVPEQIDHKLFKTLYDLKVKLAEFGLTEVQTYSFFSTKVLKNLDWKEVNLDYLVKVQNPMSAETEYLRNNIWPNLVEVVDKNLRQGVKDIAIFEISKVFEEQEGERSKETYRLSMVISDNSGTELNQIIEIFRRLGVEAELKETDPPGIAKVLFHPKRFVSIYKNGGNVGGASEVHPRILDKFGINQRVAVLEVSLEES